MIDFKCTANEFRTIGKIVQRALKMIEGHSGAPKIDAMSLNMDLSACHSNGCPLDLAGLLTADDLDFSHDVLGIRRHINRETGELKDCFVPRYALSQHDFVVDPAETRKQLGL